MSVPADPETHEAQADQRGGLALFAYGTLTFAPVLDALLGRRPPVTAAIVPGWRAARLPGRPYPGLVPAPDGRASGLLLSGLTPAEWALLDSWEGDPYRVRRVRTAVADSAGPATGPFAFTYTWRSVDETAPEDWDRDRFADEWLERYVTRLRGS
ncbi:gamma-glutamylcyclotransferase family protein [Pseudofrankia inefficax]|uniref:Putative gamma-glutamylcyclotransferase n=1 Tax=Pseudofrankia inefficax (strain DSM 45817 / CECT 9037 / DDB 130130 / EuI1c) TaxID=298654 RepID=E3J3D4_PSEI1|nr:gamma-glutamylcyclotransferase family protein [Pseudofrankia inefficax]ADP84231.1 AIG2 family protein [Pseudofrankia inefficax]